MRTPLRRQWLLTAFAAAATAFVINMAISAIITKAFFSPQQPDGGGGLDVDHHVIDLHTLGRAIRNEVGSVGVYLVVPDLSKAYEQMGVEMKVIKAGKFKAAGVDVAKLESALKGKLQLWLTEAKAIQWDYANLPKKRALEKLTKF